MNRNATANFEKHPPSALVGPGRPLRIWFFFPVLLGVFLLSTSCDFDMTEKHHCKTSSDCVGDRTCFKSNCIKKCQSLSDCAADEFCSFLEFDGAWTNACSAEDTCFDDDDCPVGEVGAVCSAEFVPDRPAGCIEWGCVDADNCPPSWRCLIDDVWDVRLGACSNGELNHPCIDDEDCNDSLQCDIWENICVASDFDWMAPEGMDE